MLNEFKLHYREHSNDLTAPYPGITDMLAEIKNMADNEENNQQDYETVSGNNSDLGVPITINLSQYLGEEIIAINN